MKSKVVDFRDLAIRERIRLAAASDGPRAIAEFYGVSHACIWQLRALSRLKGRDGESIKDAIDQRMLAWSRVAAAVQAIGDGDDVTAIQKSLLAARSVGRKIARGYDPTRSTEDRRRTQSGRRKRDS